MRGGQVRCGKCNRAFNALNNLKELPQSLGLGNFKSREEKMSMGGNGESTGEFYLLDDVFEDKPLESTNRFGFFWAFSAFSMLVLITLQLAWFNREKIYGYYPELLPHVRVLCDWLNCEPFRHKNLSAFRLIDRDVREHPNIENALLVNATIINEHQGFQSYPTIQLVLFDTEGRIVGERKFKPQEYFSSELPLGAQMPYQTPVHFLLEIASTKGQEAVSFEFRFL